jgi:hypothetical protein
MFFTGEEKELLLDAIDMAIHDLKQSWRPSPEEFAKVQTLEAIQARLEQRTPVSANEPMTPMPTCPKCQRWVMKNGRLCNDCNYDDGEL